LFGAVSSAPLRTSYLGALVVSVALLGAGRWLCAGVGVHYRTQRRWISVALVGWSAVDVAVAVLLLLTGVHAALSGAACLAVVPVGMIGLALMLWALGKPVRAAR
jgi:hypothetical protein